jgi:hypothetical protein
MHIDELNCKTIQRRTGVVDADSFFDFSKIEQPNGNEGSSGNEGNNEGK